MSNIAIGSVYEINQQLSSKEKILDPIICNQKLIDVAQDMCDRNMEYLMLLCNDLHDYTVFNIHSTNNASTQKALARELLATLNNRGNIVSIDRESDGAAWEIWIRTENSEAKKDFCYYLFDYTFGVVEVE